MENATSGAGANALVEHDRIQPGGEAHEQRKSAEPVQREAEHHGEVFLMAIRTEGER